MQTILTLLKLLATALGLWQKREEENTGAALQRGEDAEQEIKDTSAAREAMRDPALSDLGGVLNDPANRLSDKK